MWSANVMCKLRSRFRNSSQNQFYTETALKKLIWNLLRWSVPIAIIAWLVVGAVRNDSFSRLANEPKHWDLLALATLVCFVAVLVTMVRWYFLVRALDVPLTWNNALRLGFLGYLLNFISPGAVGGDLFKVVFLRASGQVGAPKWR